MRLPLENKSTAFKASAVKCRGREYLRIIYGPEYTAPEHLERLRSRSLGKKRSLALVARVYEAKADGTVGSLH